MSVMNQLRLMQHWWRPIDTTTTTSPVQRWSGNQPPRGAIGYSHVPMLPVLLAQLFKLIPINPVWSWLLLPLFYQHLNSYEHLVLRIFSYCFTCILINVVVNYWFYLGLICSRWFYKKKNRTNLKILWFLSNHAFSG